MTDLVLHRAAAPENESQAIVLPPPRGGEIAVRLAVLDDVPFIDGLQLNHARRVGWFPTKQIECNHCEGQWC